MREQITSRLKRSAQSLNDRHLAGLAFRSLKDSVHELGFGIPISGPVVTNSIELGFQFWLLQVR